MVPGSRLLFSHTTCIVSTKLDSLDAINPTFPLSGGGAAQEALDGFLCVQYDNSESKGEFYEVKCTRLHVFVLPIILHVHCPKFRGRLFTFFPHIKTVAAYILLRTTVRRSSPVID